MCCYVREHVYYEVVFLRIPVVLVSSPKNREFSSLTLETKIVASFRFSLWYFVERYSDILLIHLPLFTLLRAYVVVCILFCTSQRSSGRTLSTAVRFASRIAQTTPISRFVVFYSVFFPLVFHRTLEDPLKS